MELANNFLPLPIATEAELTRIHAYLLAQRHRKR